MKRNFSIIIGILTFLIVFLLPFGIHIDLGPGPNSLISMVWDIPFEPAWYSIRFFSAFQYYFAYCFFRIFFVIDIFLLFIGKFNKMRFFLIGIISEIIPLVIAIPSMFILNSHGDNLNPIIFPIPFLMIFDLIIILLANRLKINNVNN